MSETLRTNLSLATGRVDSCGRLGHRDSRTAGDGPDAAKSKAEAPASADGDDGAGE